MTHTFRRKLAVACALALVAEAQTLAADFEQLANSTMHDDRPTAETSRLLQDELLFQRATQVYLWAMPLINTMGMKVGSEKAFGAGYNVLPIWKDRLSAKTLVTTPNSDVIYAMSYVDLGKVGPLVMEAPEKLQGILLDFWQRSIPGPTIRGRNYLGDIGFFGPDGGKGGKFLLLPPGYIGEVADGYHVYRSETNNVFIFLRGFYQDPKNVKPAVDVLEKTRIYPLNGKITAKKMAFPNASGVPANMLPASDIHAFEHLKQLMDSEHDGLADPDWMGMLASLGVEKGKRFNPNAHTRNILDQAAKTAYKMSRVVGFQQENINGVSYLLFPDRQWFNPMAEGNPFDMFWMKTNTAYRAVDARTNFFTNYYSWSPGMVSQVPGKGANYMISHRDADGEYLTGANSYKVTLPANVPVANFWSMTLYDAANSSGLDNGQPFPSLGSRDEPVVNSDGTIDLYFEPTAPKGKEGNWLRTVTGKGFFAILRLYGLTQSFFLSPQKPVGGWIVGGGPVFRYPSATDSALGGEKWGAGPTAIFIRQDSGFTYGGLVNHLWDFADESDRSDLNQTFIQPVVAYGFKSATTLAVTSEVLYDWPSDQWTVPVNLIVAQMFRIGISPFAWLSVRASMQSVPAAGPIGV